MVSWTWWAELEACNLFRKVARTSPSPNSPTFPRNLFYLMSYHRQNLVYLSFKPTSLNISSLGNPIFPILIKKIALEILGRFNSEFTQSGYNKGTFVQTIWEFDNNCTWMSFYNWKNVFTSFTSFNSIFICKNKLTVPDTQ